MSSVREIGWVLKHSQHRATQMLKNIFSYIRRTMHPLHRARKSQTLRKALSLVDFVIPVKNVCGGVIYTRIITHAAFWATPEQLEPGITACFKASVPRLTSRIFFDIGANIGRYSVMFRHLDPAITCIAVEPDPSNLRLLRLSSEATNGIVVVAAAVSNKIGNSEFFRDTLSGATGTLERGVTFCEKHYSHTGKPVPVATVTLESLVEAHGPPGIIKIDVEGHEESILEGTGWEIIEKYRPICVIECGETLHRLASQFRRYGYKVGDADVLSSELKANTTNLLAALPGVFDEILEQARRSLNGHGA
jgi:FkbM family methyltransferase